MKNQKEVMVGGKNNKFPLPQKFFNEETGELNIEALVEDYLSLVARDENLVETSLRRPPENYEKYDIKINNDVFQRDDEVLQKMFENGFTNEQAQLVYDLAEEKIIPMFAELSLNYESERQISNLVSYFGSKEKFDEVARQISAWAKQNVSPEIYDVLGSSSEGVLTLYRMMSSREPVLSKDVSEKENINQDKLREMMKDPKYWRDKDPSYIAKIEEGFQKLYPGK